MKLHPRVMILQKASLEFSEASLAIIEKHDLTYGEIAMMFGERLAQLAKYQIREERHPGQPDKPGGLE